MRKLESLVGRKFGRLSVIEEVHSKNRYMCLCKCDCGSERIVRPSNLTSGSTQSCGCLQKEAVSVSARKHGMSYTSFHSIWGHMKDRCINPKSDNYFRYGGRGIDVCEKWLTFEGFYEDMKQGYVDGLTIDRMNNNKGYSKDNCRWATMEQQSHNKRNTRYIEVDGKKELFISMCRKYNISESTLTKRIKNGWDIDKAVKYKGNIQR